MRLFIGCFLAASLGLTACAQDAPDPAGETSDQAAQDEKALYDLASEIYLKQQAAEAAEKAQAAENDSLFGFKIDDDVLENVKAKIESEREREAETPPGKLFGNTGWTKSVLTPNLVKRVKLRNSVAGMTDVESLERVRAELAALDDPYIYLIDFMILGTLEDSQERRVQLSETVIAGAEAELEFFYGLASSVYREGLSVEADPRKAAYWAMRAVLAESDEAYRAAFHIFADGIGVKADPELALDFAEHRDNQFNDAAHLYRAKAVLETDPDMARSLLEELVKGFEDDITREAEALLIKKGWAE